MAASDLGQAERRRTGKFLDPHGRRWVTQIDIISFSACAPYTPDGWTAPWLPPDDYLDVDPEDDRRLVIDYPRLIRDRKARRAEYRAELVRESTRQFGAASGPMMEAQTLPDGRKLPHPAIIAEVGLSPYGSVFAEAAMSGKSNWVLGRPRTDGTLYPMPEWAKPHAWELIGTFVTDYEDDETSGIDFSDVTDAFADEAASPSDGASAPTDGLDPYGDLEKQVDPDPLGTQGGQRVAVRRKTARA